MAEKKPYKVHPAIKFSRIAQSGVRSLRAVAQTHVLRRMIKFRSNHTLITFDCKKMIDATSYDLLEVQK